MARIINSPGVQINEVDLSTNAVTNVGTTVFVPGFAAQGPADEVLQITSLSELELVYGAPTTPAERYFHHTCREILNSPAKLLTTRLPYGSGSGEGFSTAYSALLFPVVSSSGTFEIQSPSHISFDEQTYTNILQGNFTWSNATNNASFDGTTLDTGIIIINGAATTINEGYEGYYVSITDNAQFGPDSDFTAVTRVFSLSGTNDLAQLPNSKLSFALSAASTGQGSNSLSEAIESVPTYNFGSEFYNDSVIISVMRVRNSIYEPQSLAYVYTEAHVGSLDASKKTIPVGGGTPRTFFIQDLINDTSRNIKMYINPAISNAKWKSPSSSNPAIDVRGDNNDLEALYPIGSFLPSYNADTNKTSGLIVKKIERALTHIESTETETVDILVDGGLSTIFANGGSEYYDDSVFADTAPLQSPGAVEITDWRAVFNVFNNFCQNTRKDCVFISDPLRQIFVNGENVKIINVKGNTFTEDIYTPLKNCYTPIESNYSATYANWVKNYDPYTDKQVWLPISGYVAAVYARSDAATQPWFAPAGLTRGVINNITDLAFNPNQKQRDYLYTLSLNPVVFFANDGYVVFGQKTLQSKPSAFDRVNVRRLFLVLERSVQKTLQYYVFEPNTEFTRTRVRNSITPILDLAKNTQGLYDYQVVVDERNNTPDVIDRNELAVDIYIKPVRTAEFILVNFIATRTNQSFEELI